ncbi:MAG: hypothetical protein GY898_14310 [Proteobacteria bacterium]|nr:hypothetical protein [Pseudomonadota bacterium]
MIELFADVDLSQDAAAYIASGLRALADCDGLHNNELALVEEFERGVGIDPTNGGDFAAAGGGPLSSDKERELFLSSLQLLALADGRISDREDEWINAVCSDLGITGDRKDELAVQAKQYLLGSLAGVSAFRPQAEAVGHQLGLTDTQISAVLDDA